MVRWLVGSCSSSASDSPSGPSPSWTPGVFDLEDIKLGSRRVDPNFESALGAGWCFLRRAWCEGNSGASSSPDCPKLPPELLFPALSSSISPRRSSSSGSCVRRVLLSLPTRRFRNGILAPSSWYRLLCSFDGRREGEAAEWDDAARGSSSSRSSSRSESSSGPLGWRYS